MSLAVANRNGGKTSERGLFSSLGAAMAGDVISGFRVRPESTLSMQVRIGGEFNANLLDDRGRLIDLSDNAIIRDGLGFYSVFTDDGQAISAAVPAAHASLARRDYVVLYIKKSQARVKSPVDNANGVVQAVVVAGVPAASPSAPSASAIQTAIGAGNPYIILAQLNVGAGDTTITSSKIVDLRMAATEVGKIIPFGADFALRPDRTVPADGRAISRTDYSLLFRYFGTLYGAGDGSTTFNVPNYKGRVLVGMDANDTDFNTLGKSGGEKSHVLTIPEMPSHSHNTAPAASDGNVLHGGTNGATANITMGGGNWRYSTNPQSSLTGGGQAHNNLQPYMSTNFIISC